MTTDGLSPAHPLLPVQPIALVTTASAPQHRVRTCMYMYHMHMHMYMHMYMYMYMYMDVGMGVGMGVGMDTGMYMDMHHSRERTPACRRE